MKANNVVKVVKFADYRRFLITNYLIARSVQGKRFQLEELGRLHEHLRTNEFVKSSNGTIISRD